MVENRQSNNEALSFGAAVDKVMKVDAVFWGTLRKDQKFFPGQTQVPVAEKLIVVKSPQQL